jgi:hypothetical protein
MNKKLEQLYAVVERLDAEQHGLAGNLISDICAYLQGDLLDTEWIEKKAIALSLGKRISEVEFVKQKDGWKPVT